MAKRKRMRTTFRRRTRRKRRGGRRLALIRNPRGIPQRRRVRLKYADYHGVDLTTLTRSGIIVSCNSVYDPYQSGVGHQPRYFDEWATLYKRYAVIRSKVKIINPPEDQFKDHHVVCAIHLGNIGALSTTNVYDWYEPKSAWVKTLSPKGATVVRQKVNMRKQAAVRNILDERDWGGNVSGNPTNQTYFSMNWLSSSNLSGVFTVHYVVTYDVVFMEPEQVAAS